MADGGRPNATSNAHESHDPEPIVALMDRDVSAEDRAIGEAMVASCPDCARLQADLLAIARSQAELPNPTRPRDFVLSPDLAASLRSDRQREPLPAAARLSGDMTRTPTAHAVHDRMLIASFVDRSIPDDERARAEAQLAACDACARLHSDLAALSEATRALPTPPRPREFTLSMQDAERLRVRGLRRLFGFFGSAGDAFSRPLAIGLTTLGIAGLLVGTVPAAFSGLASGGATSLSTIGTSVERNSAAGTAPEMAAPASAAPSEAPALAPAASGEAAAQATSAPGEVAPAPAASAGDTQATEPDVLFQGGEQNNVTGEPDAGANGDLYQQLYAEADGPSPLILAGGLLLLAGLALFGLRWTGRRLGAD